MKSFGIKIQASILAISAVLGAAPALAQSAPPADADQPADPDEIIVTATLRNENLQDVPIAVTAFSGATLDKAGVRDVKSFEQVAASFNANSTQSESGGTTLRVRGVGTTGNNTGLESAVGIFIDGVYQSRPGVALGDLLDVQQIELLRGPQGTLFGRNTSAGAVSIKTAKPNLNAVEGFANATYGNYNLMNLQAGVSLPLADHTAGIRLSAAWRDRDGFMTNAVGGKSNDKNRYIVRGQFYYEPNNVFNVRLIGDYSQYDELCCDAIIVRDTSYVAAGFYALNGLPANGGAAFTGDSALANLQTSNNAELHDKTKQWGASAELNYTLGNAQLTSITAYRDFKAESRQETDFVSVLVYSTSDGTSASNATSAHSFTKVKTFTQELRLAGSTADGKFDYLIGGYYSDERIDEIQAMTLGADHQAYISAALQSAVPAAFVPLLGSNPARNIFAGGVSSAGNQASNSFKQSARNWSIFTNETIHLGDRFKINLGARYSDDRKHGVFDQLSANSPACTAVLTQPLPASLAPLRPLAAALTCFPFATRAGTPSVGPVEYDRVFKDNELVYTGKLLWEPIDNINTYVSFTHGYKSGGFNLDPTAAIVSAANNPTGTPAFRSERVNAYEFGIKARLFDNVVTTNFALFRQDFQDFQVLEFTGTQFNTFNVKGVRAEGFELETTIRPARNFTFSSAVTYSDAKYNRDCDFGTFNTVTTLLCGQQLTNAPLWTVVTGIDWSHTVGESLKFGLNGSIRMESDRRTSTPALLAVAAGTGNITIPTAPGGGVNGYIKIPNAIQDGNFKVNLRATIGSKDDGWALEFWGNNIFNEITRNVTFNTPLRGVGSLGGVGAGGAGVSRSSFVAEPRTYGVTLRAKF